MVKIKICGITNLEDALLAAAAGADALGFIFVEGTPRCVRREEVREIVEALPPFVTKVGVFADAALEYVKNTLDFCALDLAQLHGQESPEYCRALLPRVIRAVRVRGPHSIEELPAYPASAYLLDGPRSGHTFPWELARVAAQQHRVILAGGLTPENIAQAVAIVQPYGVDVCGGVEVRAGKKAPQKLVSFISRARAAA